MEEHFARMTTRQIKPGALADFERAWRPGTHPEGMRNGLRTKGKSSGLVLGVQGVVRKVAGLGRGGAPTCGDGCPLLAEQEAFYRGRELIAARH